MTSVSTDRRFGVNTGAAIKVPCRVATTANITLSGHQTIDGQLLVDDDRVLVKNQTDQKQNGIYVVDSGTWARAPDWDGSYDAQNGSLVYITSGTTNGGLFYVCNTANPITIGTTNVSFAVVALSSLVTIPLPIAQGGTAQATKATAAAALGVVALTGAAGTANAQTATAPANYTAFGTDDVFVYVPSVTNTGAVTLTITPSGGAALAAANVFANGAACVGGELALGVPALLVHDGARLQLASGEPLVRIKPASATMRTASFPDYDVSIGNLPSGVIMDYAGSVVPTGWLECDGSAVSRTTYANLFTALSTTWGTGDGATTFNLPDFRGRARLGKGTGTLAESVTSGNVNTGTDTFTVASNNTKWITGQAVVLTTTTTLPAGLSLATTYYVIRASATTIKFATTLANAQNGTAIDLTTQGTGTHTVTGTLTARTLAEIGGEEAHAMSSTELLAHTHSTTAALVGAGTAVNTAAGINLQNTAITSSSVGGNAAMNVMPPFASTMAIIKT